MPKLGDVLNSKEFRNASRADQDAYLQQIGLSRESAFSIEGVNEDKEPGFIEKSVRSLGRGVATAAELLGGVPLAENIRSGEAPSWIDPYAAKVVDYSRQWKEEHPSLSNDRDSSLSQFFQGALESQPYSVAVSGVPMAIEVGVGAATQNPYMALGAAGAANLASYKAQEKGQFVQTYLDKRKEIENKQGYQLTPEQNKKLIEEATKYAQVSAGGETVSDVIPEVFMAFMPTGARVTAKTASKIGAILDTSLGTVVKNTGKVIGLNIAGEVPTETATQAWEDKVTNPNLGLEDKFKENLIPTIGSTVVSSVLFGGTVGAIKAGVVDRQTNRDLQHLLFSDVDLSGIPLEQKDKYLMARVSAAHSLRPTIEQQIGKEAADNFIKHIEEATTRTIDPTTPYGRGSLPFNDSIFTKTLEFDRPTTVQPGGDTDFDPLTGALVPRPPVQPIGTQPTGGQPTTPNPVQPIGPQPVQPVGPQPGPVQPVGIPTPTPLGPTQPSGKVLTPEEKQVMFQQQQQAALSEQSSATFNEILGTSGGKFTRKLGNDVTRTFTRDPKNDQNIIVTDTHPTIGSQTISIPKEQALSKLEEAVALNRKHIEDKFTLKEGQVPQAQQQQQQPVTQNQDGQVPVPTMENNRVFPTVKGKVFSNGPQEESTNIISQKDFPSAVNNSVRMSREQHMWMPIDDALKMMSSEGMKPVVNKTGGFGNKTMKEWTNFLNDVVSKGISNPVEVSVKPGETPKISNNIETLEALRQLGYQYIPVNMKYYGRSETVKEATGLVEKYNKESIGAVQEQGVEKFKVSESKTPSSEEKTYIRNSITGLDTKEYGQWIVDNAPTSSHKAIALAVQRKIDAMAKQGFKIKEDFRSVNSNVLGSISYFHGSKELIFFLNTARDNIGFNYDTVLHELLHVATTHEINQNSDMKIKAGLLLDEIVKKISVAYRQGLLDNVDSHTLNRLAYGLHATTHHTALSNARSLKRDTAIEEMFSVVLSDRGVQEVLKSINVDTQGNNKTLFSVLTDFVRRALNISSKHTTALESILDLSDEIIYSTTGGAKIKKLPKKKQGAPVILSENNTKPVDQNVKVESTPETSEKAAAVNSGSAQVIDPGTITPVSKTTSMSHIKGIIEKMQGAKKAVFANIQLPFIQSIRFNEVYEKKLTDMVKQGIPFKDADAAALIEATLNSKNGIVARMLHEEHSVINETTEYKNYIIKDNSGKFVVDDAENARNNLTDADRIVWKDLLYAGDANKIVYTSAEHARQETGLKVTDDIFNAYKLSRHAIDTVFKKSNLVRFDRALDSIISNNVPSKHIDAVKSAIIQNLMFSFNRLNRRFDSLRNDLLYIGLDLKEASAVLGGFKTIFRDMRKTLRLATEGGITGAVSRFRYSKTDNPFVVRIKEKVVLPSGEEVLRDRFATFFNTKAEADNFKNRIKTDDDLKSLFRFENINPDDFKKSNGSFHITSEQETDAQIAQLYPVHSSEKAMLERIVADTIDSMNIVTGKSATEIDAKLAEIKRGLLANINKRYLAASNRKQIKRKNEGLIRGYDEVDPLHASIADASQTSAYLAKTNSIERMTDFIANLKGQNKVDAAKEFRNSFTKYYDSKNPITRSASKLTNAATAGFLMGRMVTVFAQAHQYSTFGSMEMIKAGATTKEAAELLATNYYKAFSRRVGVSAEEFVKHIKGDKTLAKALRKSLPPGGYKMLVSTFENIAKQERSNKSSLYTSEQLEYLKKHSDNNDVTDNITKEMNNIEDGIRAGALTEDVSSKFSDVIGGISKLGMLMFNEMEIINREASLMAMFEFRKRKGDTAEVADIKATNFMRRVNGDFTRYNKLNVLRTNPYLSPIFALTSFMFHSLGILGVRTAQAFKGDKTALKSLIAFTAMSTLLGGVKGDPLVDQLFKFFTILFGKDQLLSWENSAKEGADSAITKMLVDIGFRGLPAAVGLDWTNNVSLRLPFVDTLMDSATGRSSDIGSYGAGLSWAQGIVKSTKRLYNGEFERALEEANLGGFSQIAKTHRYATEGYTTNKGAPIFFEGEPRKLTPKQALVYATGFKTPEIARTQEIINAERTLVDNLWPQRKQEAIDKYFKTIGPYLNKGEDIPDSVLEKAAKYIQDFNTSRIKAGPEIAGNIKAIDRNTLKQSRNARYKPNKKHTKFEKAYGDLTDSSEEED